MKFDSIILDIDGTIWNTTQVVADAWNKAIEDNYPQVPRVNAKILQGQFGKTMKVIADNLFTGLSEEEKLVLMDKCCIEEQAAIKAMTINITYPGVTETIEKLAKKIPVFIVSNCHDGYVQEVIKKNHLEKFITDFECYGHNGKNKDENICLVVQRNNLKAPVYVGDTQGDKEACDSAKVPFIWAAYGFGNPESYYAKIEKFADLEQVIFQEN